MHRFTIQTKINSFCDKYLRKVFMQKTFQFSSGNHKAKYKTYFASTFISLNIWGTRRGYTIFSFNLSLTASRPITSDLGDHLKQKSCISNGAYNYTYRIDSNSRVPPVFDPKSELQTVFIKVVCLNILFQICNIIGIHLLSFIQYTMYSTHCDLYVQDVPKLLQTAY